MEYTVYLRTNTVNNKQYVGQTSDFKRRERDWNCFKKTYGNDYLSNEREKYGLDAWTVETLAETDNREDAWNLEQRFIKDLNTLYPNGYNMGDGGKGSTGCKRSGEQKQKMSEAHKGKHSSPETEFKKGVPNMLLAKQVYQYTLDGELVGIWSSMHECGKNGYDYRNVSACCRGKLKSAYGFFWSFNLINNNHEASNLAS